MVKQHREGDIFKLHYNLKNIKGVQNIKFILRTWSDDLPVSILNALAEDLSLLLRATPVSYNQPHEIFVQVF